MFGSRLLVVAACIAICSGMVTSQSVLAEDENADVAEQVLQNRLNNLESQAVQRRGREPTTIDLLNRQDDKIAEQSLNALKTRDLRNSDLPILERRLDRSRRLDGGFDR